MIPRFLAPAAIIGAPARTTLRVADAVALVKFRYHVTFSNVVFGALIFATDLTTRGFAELLALYLSFNVLLYGGIYTLNDLADRRSDAAHPRKRLRPIAAGRVAPGAAAAFASAMMSAGVLTGAILFTPGVVACYGAVIGINLVYSMWGRNVRYADLVLNALPHAVRFSMGALMVERVPPAGHVCSIMLLALALSCLRRRVEREDNGWEARSTLSRYRAGELETISRACLAGVLVLAITQADDAPGFYGILLASSAVLVGGSHVSAGVRTCLRWVWVR